jgi:hypothetical protein
MLQTFRPCFRRPVFEVFCLLVVGMIAQTGPCTVTGMLLGAQMQALVSHDRVHRFVSAHVWSADQLGLTLARMIVDRLVPPGMTIDVVVDDTLFRLGELTAPNLLPHPSHQRGMCRPPSVRSPRACQYRASYQRRRARVVAPIIRCGGAARRG